MSSAALLFAGFGLRLALGLAGALFLLPAHQVSPRFYRTHLLVILGILAAASVLAWAQANVLDLVLLGVAVALAYAGSILWSLEGAPGGRLAIIGVTGLLLYLATALPSAASALAVADAWSSAALLGLALSAMLMGHSYLIAPAMSMTPLHRLLLGLLAAVAVRMLVAGLAWWTAGPPPASLPMDAAIWLALRWGVGFGGTLALGGLAWRCARIRSTQSATGILYVVVIFAFIGELIAQFLWQTGLQST